MSTATRIDIGDSEVVIKQYETLRANALGELNQAPDLVLFLRHGMSAWLCALGAPGSLCRTTCRKPLSSIAGTDSNMPGAELATILADAILNTSATTEHAGERT